MHFLGMHLTVFLESMDSDVVPFCEVSCATIQAVTWQEGVACPYDDDLAVFRFRIDHDVDLPPFAEQILQPDEQQRAQRYYREEDRQRFVYGRSLLRILVGRYTNQPPANVRFMVGANGKLELADDTGWHTNISHSGHWVLLAVGRTDVGVDIEHIAAQFSFEDTLVSNFSPEEQAYCNIANTRRRFYALWTRKEALLKATGKGMDEDFQQIPSLKGRHQTNASLIGAEGRWAVRGFVVEADYPAAVAYREMQEIPKFYTLNSVLFDSYES